MSYDIELSYYCYYIDPIQTVRPLYQSLTINLPIDLLNIHPYLWDGFLCMN